MKKEIKQVKNKDSLPVQLFSDEREESRRIRTQEFRKTLQESRIWFKEFKAGVDYEWGETSEMNPPTVFHAGQQIENLEYLKGWIRFITDRDTAKIYRIQILS